MAPVCREMARFSQVFTPKMAGLSQVATNRKKKNPLGDPPLTCTVPPYAPTPLVPLLDAESSSCKSGKGVVGFDSLATLASWPYGDFNGALSDYRGFLSGVLVCQGLVA